MIFDFFKTIVGSFKTFFYDWIEHEVWNEEVRGIFCESIEPLD